MKTRITQMLAGVTVLSLCVTRAFAVEGGLGRPISGMQIAQIVHSIVGVLFIAVMLAHIYIGTIGMEGAYQAMKTGHVDETWAKEHHAIWYNEVKEGKRPENVADHLPYALELLFGFGYDFDGHSGAVLP